MQRNLAPPDRWLTLSRRLWTVALVLWVAIVFVGTKTGKFGGFRAAIGFVLLFVVSIARNADPALPWPRPLALLASLGFIAFCGLLIHEQWGASDWQYVGMLVAILTVYLVLVAVALTLERSRAARR